MKLQELLNPYFKENNSIVLGYKQLEVLKPLLEQCDEFKTLDDLEIIRTSTFFNTQTQTPHPVSNYKVGDTCKFFRNLYLYQIYQSPGVIPQNKLNTPIKDGMSISPLIYSKNDLEPYKTIRVRFNPSVENRFDITQKIYKLLNNPQDYEIPMEHSLIVQGVLL